jgi:hypothetical protein
MGRFRVKVARTREFEGPSQQCSSQIPLRCLSEETHEIQVSVRLPGEYVQVGRSAAFLIYQRWLPGIMVTDLAFFNGLPSRTKKLR